MNMSEQWAVFSLGDASDITGMSRRKVLLLIEQEVVSSTLPSGGRGNARRFTLLDIVRIQIALRLENFGMAPRFMRQVVSKFSDRRLSPTKDGTPMEAQITASNGKLSVTFIPVEEKALHLIGGTNDQKEDMILKISIGAIINQTQRRAGEFNSPK
jgi:DNA-binding transcriptional MerR regulator